VRRRPRLLRALLRPLRPVSGLGWGVLVVGLTATAAGWWWGWVELAVVGAGLLGAIALAVVFTVGVSSYRMVLDVSDHRVTVGQRVAGRIEVRSTARGRLLPARIELPVGRTVADFPLPSLAPGAVHEDLFTIPTTRRSVVRVGPVRSVRGDPWGLVARRIAWTDAVEVFVHPGVVPLTGSTAGVLRDLEGQATRVVAEAELSFHALRDYVPGDDRRHIHWRTTARTGTLMVRQFEDTRRTHTAVALATSPLDYADDDEFELAVAAAASLGVQALRDERDLTFLAGGGRLRVDSPGTLLDDLARLGRRADGRRGPALVPWVIGSAPEASVVMLVTGSLPTSGELRLAASRIPAGVPTLALTCLPGVRSEVAVHGSLALGRLGDLRDLPRLLRRVVAG
jgi:uncharacterized protein (DUF58 family)